MELSPRTLLKAVLGLRHGSLDTASLGSCERAAGPGCAQQQQFEEGVQDMALPCTSRIQWHYLRLAPTGCTLGQARRVLSCCSGAGHWGCCARGVAALSPLRWPWAFARGWRRCGPVLPCPCSTVATAVTDGLRLVALSARGFIQSRRHFHVSAK